MGEEDRHLDCIIIGAGISGLDAAYHIKVGRLNMIFQLCNK